MLIDWFTVVAQLINFVILVVALRYLLYGRIVDAMERRARSIATREEAAEEQRRIAEERADELERERRQLQARRDDILEEARNDADQRRRRLLDEARREVDRQEEQWAESVRARRERLLAELQQATGEKSVAIARRLLEDLADVELEGEVVRGFVRRLDESNGRSDETAEALRADESPLYVRTAFDLTDQHRDRVRTALRDLVGDEEREIEWERDPELVAGIVVRAGSRSIGWTVDDYLDGLEDEFAELLRAELGSETPEREPQPGEGGEG